MPDNNKNLPEMWKELAEAKLELPAKKLTVKRYLQQRIYYPDVKFKPITKRNALLSEK